MSPPHSSADEAEQDEVDSDFDRPEEEDKDEEDAANRAVVEAERAERKRKVFSTFLLCFLHHFRNKNASK